MFVWDYYKNHIQYSYEFVTRDTNGLVFFSENEQGLAVTIIYYYTSEAC